MKTLKKSTSYAALVCFILATQVSADEALTSFNAVSPADRFELRSKTLLSGEQRALFREHHGSAQLGTGEQKREHMRNRQGGGTHKYGHGYGKR